MFAACGGLACQTETVVPVVDPAAFTTPAEPLPKVDLTDDATAPLTADPASRYPDLFAPSSFAVLLNVDLLLDRLDADAAALHYPPAQVEAERASLHNLAAQFVICELHLRSSFGDLGVAHDAVALRNMEVTLADDTGRSVQSAAVQLGTSQEIEYPEKTEVMRINIVLFPKAPVPGASPLIQPTTQQIYLALAGEGSQFRAEWRLNPSFSP